jgi:hypothetical protein
MPAPPIVIPPIGVMPPIYIPPPGVAPPIYYPSVPSTGPGFPTNPIAPGGTTPPWGIPAPPVVWPGPTPPPPDPPTVAPPIVLPPTVWPPLGPNAPAGKTWVIAWIQGSGWHSLYVDLSQPKK